MPKPIPQTTRSPKRHGGNAAEHALLDSQLPQIASALRDKPITANEGGWRVGSSLKIWRNGNWFDHKVGEGGRGALALIKHYRECGEAEAICWARQWLAEHLEPGPCSGNDDTDEVSGDEAERIALITTLYGSRLPIPGTPAEAYLRHERGIDPGQLDPAIVQLLGWLPEMRGDEGQLVCPFTDQAGEVVALHLTHITPDGNKSAIEPARVTNRGPANWRSQGLLRFDFGRGPEMVVVEGLEDALSGSSQVSRGS